VQGHRAADLAGVVAGMELLDNFRSSTSHLALVVDEYGEIQGLVTLQDLFEAIAGEFKAPLATRVAGNVAAVDALPLR
jgi:Mg2+/Co2+ transporter CorB